VLHAWKKIERSVNLNPHEACGLSLSAEQLMRAVRAYKAGRWRHMLPDLPLTSLDLRWLLVPGRKPWYAGAKVDCLGGRHEQEYLFPTNNSVASEVQV